MNGFDHGRMIRPALFLFDSVELSIGTPTRPFENSAAPIKTSLDKIRSWGWYYLEELQIAVKNRGVYLTLDQLVNSFVALNPGEEFIVIVLTDCTFEKGWKVTSLPVRFVSFAKVSNLLVPALWGNRVLAAIEKGVVSVSLYKQDSILSTIKPRYVGIRNDGSSISYKP